MSSPPNLRIMTSLPLRTISGNELLRRENLQVQGTSKPTNVLTSTPSLPTNQKELQTSSVFKRKLSLSAQSSNSVKVDTQMNYIYQVIRVDSRVADSKQRMANAVLKFRQSEILTSSQQQQSVTVPAENVAQPLANNAKATTVVAALPSLPLNQTAQILKVDAKPTTVVSTLSSPTNQTELQESDDLYSSDSGDFVVSKHKKLISIVPKEPKSVVEKSSSAADITHPVLMSILPPEYKYKCTDLQTTSDPSQIVATVRANIFSKEEALKWLRLYEARTLTNFRSGKMKENLCRVLFKKRFRCHHNTRASEPCSKTKKAHKKHTSCQAVLIITVKVVNMPRSLDPFLKEFPCVIYMKHTHNHNIKCADALRFRRPYTEMEELGST
ncbi:Beta-amylase [Frankliniella fusca]|uniref:Beta-amylase n=1 Tax=Frankliniella fusca TaxID=407009 RepID=A0AAE1H9K4_9NEOP|nr:Beta-amylase [Frankliniella fusca]